MRIKRSSMKQNNDIPDKTMERIRKLMRLKESTTSEGEARETALPGKNRSRHFKGTSEKDRNRPLRVLLRHG